MGVVVHQHAVLEAAGLALVGVADDGLRVPLRLGDGAPLPARRKTGSPAACEATLIHDVEERSRAELADRLLQALVSTRRPIAVERGAPLGADLGEHALASSGGRRRREWSGPLYQTRRR